MKQFRKHTPQRKYTGAPKASYKSYSDVLAEDFNHRCGYTDCLDTWWADGFNIDHFIPKNPRHITDPVLKQKFADLENEYTNLVYACPQVNRAKSDDWPSGDPLALTNDAGDGYISPFEDFNEHFVRTNGGGILPKSGDNTAFYMWRKLKLYIRLYELLWRLEQIDLVGDRLEELRSNETTMQRYGADINAKIADLTAKHRNYRKYLGLDYRNIIRGNV